MTTGLAGGAISGTSFSNSANRDAAPDARTKSPYTSVKAPNEPATSAPYKTTANKVPEDMTPSLTWSVPSQTSIVMPPNINAITSAVRNARSRIRFFAALNVTSTASANRTPSRLSWPKACTILIAPSASEMMVPTLATLSWLVRDAFSKRRPRKTIGNTTTGIPASSQMVRLGARPNSKVTPPMPIKILRSATDTVVPTICSIIAVSAVMRLAISPGLFSSKKRGAKRNKFCCTATRMSPTTRSPNQLTK